MEEDAKAYRAASQPVWDDITIESATPLPSVPTEAAGDGQSAQSNALAPSVPSKSPLDDAEKLAFVLGIPKGIKIPSLRDIHTDIRRTAWNYDFNAFTAFIGRRTAESHTWSSFTNIALIVPKLLPAVPLIAHWGLRGEGYGFIAVAELPRDEYVSTYMRFHRWYPRGVGGIFSSIENEARILIEQYREWEKNVSPIA
ncbi:hypothetical protein DM02DRAFT_633461 [Periconia macrospinosa]|uniref:Uncharacterized protein n=1 Tax=Periconia macrospinosa TaxID=97972 RepID=A0A2V1D9C2_9PLEO|nr:hypothetical protein DM02DRAFT_633461 [Periconia macrospinosa]